MKTRQTEPIPFPNDAELTALRAWYAGLDARAAVARYLGDRKAPRASARGVLGRVRRALIAYARSRHRDDMADAFGERSDTSADTVARAIGMLRNLPVPEPHIADGIDQWLAAGTRRRQPLQCIRSFATARLLPLRVDASINVCATPLLLSVMPPVNGIFNVSFFD